MAAITVTHLSFTHDGGSAPVFEDLSLTLDTSWRLGLVGRNGRGKTTLLRLLAGELTGRGRILAPLPFVLFPGPIPADGAAAGAVFQGLDGADWQIERELRLLGLSPSLLERPWATLSGGQQTRLQLAALFLREGAYPLIDEPTNHLDREGRQLVATYLSQKPGFLLVSHDRSFLTDCTDHILSLGREEVTVTGGGFPAWWREYQRREARERAEQARLQKEIGRLEAAARQTTQWSARTESGKYGRTESGLKADRGYVGHKSAKLMKRAKGIEARRQRAAEEKAGLLRETEKTEALLLHPLTFQGGPIARLEGVSVCYGAVQTPPADLVIESGQRIALTGGNGVGKSSLLRLLAGEPLSIVGRHEQSRRAVVSYLPQGISHLRGSPADFAAAEGLELTRFFTILRKMDFSREAFTRPMEQFSDGQRKKVLLAASLATDAHLYLWDEPLNYIDLFSRIQIERLLEEASPTLVFVEHDAAFVDKIATHRVTVGGSDCRKTPV